LSGAGRTSSNVVRAIAMGPFAVTYNVHHDYSLVKDEVQEFSCTFAWAHPRSQGPRESDMAAKILL
jgi:hypothetical protein